jgi:hypothetical protein
MVALIFLDIDGVICCNMAGRLEEAKLATLAEIVRAPQAKVVLSTDWRRQAQLKRQVVAALKRLDIEVVGATPMKAMFQPIRPQEITEWIAANGEKAGMTEWVAIDDRDLTNEIGGKELVGHFVHTHPNTGLTKRLADVAIGILRPGAVGASDPLLASPAPTIPQPGTSAAMAQTAPARLRMGGAAAAPSTLAAVRAAQQGSAGAPATANTLRSALAKPGAVGRTPLRAGAPASATPVTRRPVGDPYSPVVSKQRAVTPPKRWSGASPVGQPP